MFLVFHVAPAAFLFCGPFFFLYEEYLAGDTRPPAVYRLDNTNRRTDEQQAAARTGVGCGTMMLPAAVAPGSTIRTRVQTKQSLLVKAIVLGEQASKCQDSGRTS